MSKMYDFNKIESKWQKYWEDNKTFKTNVRDFSKPKFYALDMFPYPSGSGLHAGHPEGYTATDIVSRMKRMQGYNVLHPMGFDSFGLPAEQYAIDTGNHPTIFTEKNIAFFTNFDQQDLISLDTFMRLFENYSFGIMFLHLTEKSDAWTEIKLAGIRDYCQSHYPGREIDYKIIGEENFLDNVEKLFHESAIDVMVVPNRKRNIFARLFNPSIAHKMLFHTDTPLIAIPS